MHPSRSFRWTDRNEMLAFARSSAFAHIFVQSDLGPFVAHVPVWVDGDRIRFHVARSNVIAAHLDAAVALASFIGADGYISPDWYGTENQVPTWNYIAVEAVGLVVRLPDSELPRLLDELSAEHERKLAPKPEWTRDKMDDRIFQGMLKSVIGFEFTVEQLRGTRKLGQNKTAEEVSRVVSALEQSGNPDLARAMRDAASS